jgi:transglutaminase-like putative cysteine protease
MSEKIKNHYLALSRTLNDEDLKSKLLDLFDKRYDYLELLPWTHERLSFVAEREIHEDPFEILQYGKGKCGEFAILYTVLCLAHGYQSRLVVDVLGDHMWTEIKLEGRWVHVDPTEKRVNDPKMYVQDWHKDVKVVYAFENGQLEDVTVTYRN